MNHPTANPAQKVSAAAIAGALVTVGVAIYQQIAHHAVDATMATAITTIVAFAAGYFVPAADDEAPASQAPV